ncbi:MAG: CRISPR-associated endoribonuclease Cas6 [Sporolactobacillus sp.]
MGTELIVTALLKRQLPYQNAQEEIGNLINFSMLKDERLKVLHKQKFYKFYSFNNLYPVESDGLYQSGKIYIFRMRFAKQDVAEKMKKCLSGLENRTFKILALELRVLHPRFINMLYTITPCIVTVDSGPFMPDGDLVFLKERLEINAVKKYQALFGKQLINRDFIERIEIINRKPTVTRYKDMTYLGNKIKVFVRSDESSQKLAGVVTFAGLGEKSSSLGAGFCFVY